MSEQRNAPTGDALRQAIDRQRTVYLREQEAFYVLMRHCHSIGHQYVQDGDSAKCSVCGSLGGWWCETSPTKECQYEGGSEWCIHCHAPEERK